MSNHPIFADDMKEIVESFIIETQEIFEQLDNDLLDLEQTPNDKELVDKIFRAVHTVKGTSGFLSLEQLSLLSHHFEDVLNKLRRNELDFNPAMMDVMFASFDTMKVLVEQVIDRNLESIELDGLTNDLNGISSGTYVARRPEAAPPENEGESEEETAPDPVTNHPIFADDLKEIVESFIVETQEIFEQLDNDLLDLEQTPNDKDLIDKIFRAVHTVKGTSGFLSLEQLSALSHHFEDVLNKLRRDELDYNPATMDVMFSAFDTMKILMHQVVDQSLMTIDLDELINDLNTISNGAYITKEKKPSTKSTKETVPEKNIKNRQSDRQQTSPKEGDTKEIIVNEEVVPASAPVVDESTRPRPTTNDEAPEDVQSGNGIKRNANNRSTETIRVEVDRLDSLLNLVGELVLGRNRLLQLVTDMSLEHDADKLTQELTDTSAQVDFITTELQTAIMHTRMIQIGRVFNKFPRVVRDLAKEFNKQIDLVIEGKETELDKSLIEEIGDPLVHLIRNAADHGIELPEERQARGKPERGILRLAAAHEGNHIAIVIEDDGAGMDPEKLKRKAIEKHLITKKDAAEMSDADVFNLIFKPGFSTAKSVSKVSGRGVGMDVVKTNITRLNGTVSIDSKLGRGTSFTLKLPLTLAIIQSLLVRAENETYAIPLHSVIEVVGLNDDVISTIRGREVIRLREKVLPLVRVSDVLNAPRTATTSRQYAVIVGIAHYRLGLVVNDLVGQKEIVIKPLGSYLKKIPGVAGSTILGDGRVIMILDIGELVRMENEKLRTPSETGNLAA